MLASASNAMVVGFNVRPNAEARALADREGVEIRTYRVIYQLTDDIEQALVGMLKPVRTEETIGEVEVRALFRVSRLGTIAGSYVTNGTVRRGASVRVVRDGTVIYETTHLPAQAVQGRRPRGRGGLRVRHPPRRLQRREGRRRARGLRDARGGAHRPRDAGLRGYVAIVAARPRACPCFQIRTMLTTSTHPSQIRIGMNTNDDEHRQRDEEAQPREPFRQRPGPQAQKRGRDRPSLPRSSFRRTRTCSRGR